MHLPSVNRHSESIQLEKYLAAEASPINIYVVDDE